MNVLLLIATVVLWLVVIFLGFLLLGTLRALALLRWRMEQLEATTPSRIGRSGLRTGVKAPDFTLPSVAGVGADVCLHDFAGRKVLLVFTQAGCGPCQMITPELNRLQRQGEVQVLVVNNGTADVTRAWATKIQAEFPVLSQEQLSLSKRYQVLATPFAFLIDEQGTIASKGIVNNAQHIGYLLAGASEGANEDSGESESEPNRAEDGGGASVEPVSRFISKELHHV